MKDNRSTSSRKADAVRKEFTSTNQLSHWREELFQVSSKSTINEIKHHCHSNQVREAAFKAMLKLTGGDLFAIQKLN